MVENEILFAVMTIDRAYAPAEGIHQLADTSEGHV